MTAYSLWYSMNLSTNSSGDAIYLPLVRLAIRAGEFPIRVVQLTAASGYPIGPAQGYQKSETEVGRHSGATISGGLSMTPIPAREGSPPASCTVRYQTATYNLTNGTVTPNGSAVTISTSRVSLANVSDEWKLPVEITVAPGSVLSLIPYDTVPSSNEFLASFAIWMDEERIYRSH